MNVYRVVKKKKRDQAFWDDFVYLIVASDYGNAEDKANNFGGTDSKIHSIEMVGETTNKLDVFILNGRL